VTLALLLPLVQHVPEVSTALSLSLAPVHQLVEPRSILWQDHFPQFGKKGIL
jgi:hypothetical protein